MSKLKIELPTQSEIVLSKRVANLLMDSGDGNAALLYIYILSHFGEITLSESAKRLSLSEDAVLAALERLKSCGLVGKTDAPSIPDRSDTLPEYSQTDVAEYIGSDKSFKFLVDFCEEQLGKILSTVDLQVLLGIYSWLGLPVDVICLLITSCVEEAKKKLGPGRVPTLRMIEKRAKLWVRDGVLTPGRAEEYLREQERRGEEKARVSAILGIVGRSLSPTEEKYISEWLSLGLSDELIAAAYDKTVINTGSLKWGYINTILKSWHESGAKTVADVKKSSSAPVKRDADRADENAAMKLKELNRKRRMTAKEQAL